MTNTAKHFICYSFLLGLIVLGFGAYRQHLLESTLTEKELNNRIVQTQAAVIEAKAAIEQRDKQLSATIEQLNTAQKLAVSAESQIALVNNLLKLPSPIIKSDPSGPGSNPSYQIPTTSVTALTDEVVTCKKCQVSLDTVVEDKKALEVVNSAQAIEIKDCRALVAREPHTRFQRFRKGFKWVLSLGKS